MQIKFGFLILQTVFIKPVFIQPYTHALHGCRKQFVYYSLMGNEYHGSALVNKAIRINQLTHQELMSNKTKQIIMSLISKD